MKCKSCGTNYHKIDTLLVCENGHTLQNTTEVTDDDLPSTMRGKSKSIHRKKKQQVVYKADGCKVMKVILMKLLFDELRSFFDIKDDILFRYFTEFFEFKDSKLDSVIDVSSKVTLKILVYLAKRAEMESKGQIYLFDEFIATINAFDWNGTLEIIRRKIPALETEINTSSYRVSVNISKIGFKQWLDDLTAVYPRVNPRRPKATFRKPDTGILEKSVETAKYNMRRLIRNDLPLMKKYFEVICSDIEVEITPELEFYFEKYIYTYDPGIVIFPDYDFAFFVMAYLIHKNAFERTATEAVILDYVDAYRSNVMREHYMPFILRLNDATTPEVYIATRNRRNKARFIGLIESIEFIDAFKRLVAEDMLNLIVFKRKKRMKWDNLIKRGAFSTESSEDEE